MRVLQSFVMPILDHPSFYRPPLLFIKYLTVPRATKGMSSTIYISTIALQDKLTLCE